MLNALKNVSKSTLIMLITVVSMPIFIIILLVILQSCSNSSSHDKFESKMISASTKYFKEKNLLPESGSSSELVNLDTLISSGYIKIPNSLKDKNCEGYVTARKNGVVEELDLEGKYMYHAYLKCDNYESNLLKNNIMNDLTTSESGLYDDGNYYVYKGENVKNYVKFFGSVYRILGLDKEGYVRLVKLGDESATKPWDNKYNVEVNFPYGKSIYKDSLILKTLLKDYTNNKIISVNAKDHIVSHDVCVGKRDVNDKSVSWDLDCSEILTNQVVSLPNVSDYSRASLDPDCNSIDGRSCRNYNYLYSTIKTSWTLNSISNNSYKVYYLSSGVAHLSNASDYNSYNLVIYIDGNEKVKSGNGTEKSPYVIE